MKRIKLAQLSDLHCDGTQAWEDNFYYIIECLIENAVDIVVVTGDCADSPKKDAYECLSKCFLKLGEAMKERCNKELYLITIPGNHDYWEYYGNRLQPILRIIPAALRKYVSAGDVDREIRGKPNNVFKKKYFKKLFLPENKSIEELSALCFSKYNIALFPLNSNTSSQLTAFAQGRVTDPHKAFMKYKEMYEACAKKNNHKYNPLINIAMIHHHLLPVPSSRQEEIKEMGMMLHNPYEVLKEALRFNIDIVLHGHKHTSAVSAYNNIQTDKVVYVSSCGASADLREAQRELRILEISEYGLDRILSFTAREGNNVFERDMNHSISFDSYEKKRDSALRSQLDLNSRLVRNIKSGKSKTKSITIQTDGSADVIVYYDEITWDSEITNSEKCVTEYIESDLGRVVSPKYELGENKIIGSTSRELRVESNSKPDEQELVSLVLKPIPDNAKVHYCKLRYTILNGYVFCRRQFDEAYLWNKEGGEAQYATISTLYPVKSIDLIVNFPSPDNDGGCYFPDINDIKVYAVKRDAIPAKLNKFILNGIYEDASLEEEKDYLVDHGALKIWPENYQIALCIREPRIDLVYILRWGLPECKLECEKSLKDTKKEKRFFQLLNAFNDNDQVKQFYASISKSLEDYFNDKNLTTFIFGYLQKEKLLKVICVPSDRTNDDKISKLIVGRGLAGAAFRRRSVQCWNKSFRGDLSVFEQCEQSDHMRKVRLEDIIPNLKIESAFAFPLTMDLLAQAGEDSQSIPQCFAVLVVVSNNDKSISGYIERIKNGDKEAETETLAISTLLSESLKEISP